MDSLTVDPKVLEVLYRKAARRAQDATETVGPNSMAEHLNHIAAGYLAAASDVKQAAPEMEQRYIKFGDGSVYWAKPTEVKQSS